MTKNNAELPTKVKDLLSKISKLPEYDNKDVNEGQIKKNNELRN